MAQIDRHHENWLNELETAMAQASPRGESKRVFALLDGAFQTACYKRLNACGDRLRWHALFSGSPGADEETLAMSPMLLDLSDADASDWRAILCLADGWPMLSWIVTSETLEQLAQRLVPWCIVDADGQHMVLRFADTRRLPDIVAALTPEQHGQLFGPAVCWRYVTRVAQWAALPQPEKTCKAADSIRFDARQCAHLIGSSEADEIMASLRRHDRHLIDGFTPALAHEKVMQALVRADRYRIEQPFERERFCALMLAYPHLESCDRMDVPLADLRDRKVTFDQALESIRQMIG